DRFTFYRLADSVSAPANSATHEKDFFDGIDTSLPALAARLGEDQSKLPRLPQELTEIAKNIAGAAQAAQGSNSSAAVAPLLSVVQKLKGVTAEISQSSVA